MPELADRGPIPLKELIDRARQGAPESLGRLMEAFRPYLLQVAFDELESDLRVKESPSDLVQKSFLEAFQGFPGLKEDTPEVFQAWLRQILLNNIRDLRERFRTEKRLIDRELGGQADGAGPEIDGEVSSPSEVAIRREQALALETALGKLAPEARLLISLRHREGRSFAEIAAHLEITEEAARKRWARAVEELRQLARDASSVP